eukprot:g34397.t1
MQLSGATRTALARMPLRELALDFDYENTNGYIKSIYSVLVEKKSWSCLNIWEYPQNYASLRKLTLQFLQINCLQGLSVPSLESLTLDCSRLTDKNLKSVQAPALMELNPVKCEDVTEAGVISALAHFPRLEKLCLNDLWLHDVTSMKIVGLLAMLPESVPQLEILSLNRSTVVTSPEIKSRDPDVMPNGRAVSLEYVDVLAGLPLKEIYLDCAYLCDDDLVCLLAFPLQKLSLGMTRITRMGLSALTSLPLRELSLVIAPQVTAKGLDAALKKPVATGKTRYSPDALLNGCEAKYLDKMGKAQSTTLDSRSPFIQAMNSTSEGVTLNKGTGRDSTQLKKAVQTAGRNVFYVNTQLYEWQALVPYQPRQYRPVPEESMRGILFKSTPPWTRNKQIANQA